MREVVLKIKSASHRLEDLEIPCNLALTIKELKQLIQRQYPLHPEVRDQRLIYAGHLLEDSQTLSQILLPNSQPSQSSFTLHLACTSSFFQPQRQQQRTQETHKSDVHPTVNPNPQTHFPQPTSVIPPEMLGLHQLYVQQMMIYMNEWSQGRYHAANQNANTMHNQSPNTLFNQPPNVAFSQPSQPSNPAAPHIPNLNPSNNFQGATNAEQVPVADANNEAARVAEVARVEEVARAAAEAARAANAARIAAARDDDEAPRDVIDWMYTFSRVVLIFSVVYFYSNFTRFFLVVILSALVFILQRRPMLWNRQAAPAAAGQEGQNAAVPPRPRPAENQGERVREEIQQEAPTPPEVNVASEGSNPQESGDGTAAEENPVELIPDAQEDAARINPRDVTWTFLTTFFTSLIPEIPQN